MKKVSAILLVFAMALSVAACGDVSSTTDTETSASVGESITLGSSAESDSNKTTTPSEGDTNNETAPPQSGNNGTGDETPPESAVVDEVEWNAAVDSEKFENVTFTYNATFISGYDDTEPNVGTIKLSGNGMLVDGNSIDDAELIASVKTMFIDTAVAIVNNYGMFEYDSENKCYRSKEAITYNTTVLGYDTTITAENVEVAIDSNKSIAMISCKMTQEFTENGAPVTYVLNTEFTFSDYGTTTLG